MMTAFSQAKFVRWFSRWKESYVVYEVVDRFELQSLAAGGCDVLAVSLNAVFGGTAIQIVSSSGVIEHVAAVIDFDQGQMAVDFDHGTIDMSRRSLETWARDAVYTRRGESLLISRWDFTPIDKSAETLAAAANHLARTISSPARLLA